MKSRRGLTVGGRLTSPESSAEVGRHRHGGRGRRRYGYGPAYYPLVVDPYCIDENNPDCIAGRKHEKNMAHSDDDGGSIGFDDIVGEQQDIVGADIAIGMLIGEAADEMTMGNPQVALAKLAVARKAVPNAIAVFHRQLNARRRQPLGFTAVDVPVSTATPVSATALPQQLFKAKRMVIPSLVANAIVVNDVKVGNKSQLVGTEEAVTGAMYSELAVGTFIDFLTANVGNKISVELQNLNLTVTTATTVTMIGIVAE